MLRHCRAAPRCPLVLAPEDCVESSAGSTQQPVRCILLNMQRDSYPVTQDVLVLSFIVQDRRAAASTFHSVIPP